MNGGSGISTGTKHFLSLVLAPMIAGYGLTESCAAGSLGSPLEYNPDAIGPMPPCVEIKLISQPELGYDADAANPQGEVWLRGPNMTKQYFKNPEETKKAITEDGWFKTGDIGEFDANGHLRIIDRLKNLVKMQGGEYIALEKLETVYRGSQCVANVLVYADSEISRPLAVIMANEKILADKAKEIGVAESDMYTDKKVNDLVLKELQATGRQAGLVSMEIVGAVVISDIEWTPDSGLVTATQKLNRKVIQSKYKDEIAKAAKNCA
jgi:long-chain acyl-CoA synthetase